jgi:hypothetical protein
MHELSYKVCQLLCAAAVMAAVIWQGWSACKGTQQ